MSVKFQRTKENFSCENCGFAINGTGYTNHCPQCLWSKHVDVNPGDRAAECQGMMAPIEVTTKKGDYRILHRCVICEHERWNRAAKEDDFEVILQIAAERQWGDDE